MRRAQNRFCRISAIIVSVAIGIHFWLINNVICLSQGKKGKKVPAIDLSRAQLFACVHHDSKSGIPHLHILINRIDLDGNLMTNRFIGNRCTMAAHTINVEEGWELPEDIHKANVNEITDACYKVLSEMRAYSWNDYVDRIKALGYDVKVLEDKDGVKHGYTIMKGNSRYKSSILGVGRDLMLKNLRGTWLKFHKANQVTVGSTDTGMGMAKPVSKTCCTRAKCKCARRIKPVFNSVVWHQGNTCLRSLGQQR